MNLSVRVKPRSRTTGVKKVSEREFVVCVRSPALEGRANEEAIELLVDFFGVPKSRISVLRGAKSRNKIIRIF